MYFSPDIILSFFIVAKGIVSDRNVLFMAILGDFTNAVEYIVLPRNWLILG